VNRAEALLSSESLRVKNLEDRLNILHSARLPSIEPARPAHPRTFAREAEGSVDEEAGGSRLEGLEVKDLNPAQRRKVAMLRGKRERLEKERRALQGGE
jgi:DASH complex subunit SPC19